MAAKNIRAINPNDGTTQSPAAKGSSGLIDPWGSELMFSGRGADGGELSFTFVINPNSLKVARKKLGSYILTKFGYERQNWGNDLFVFEYSGSTGVFKPQEGWPNVGYPNFDIRDTSAWIKFREFEDFYESTGNDQNMVKMNYWGYKGQYLGSLDDFQLHHDVMKEPYILRYSFKYTGIPIPRTDISVSVSGTSAGNPETDNARSDNPAV